MNTINWTTESGVAISVSISTDFRLNSQGFRKEAGEREVVIAATINGASEMHMGIQPVKGHATCVAKIGRIGITAENLAPITEAIEKAKAEISSHNEQLAAHAAKLNALGNGDINNLLRKGGNAASAE